VLNGKVKTKRIIFLHVNMKKIPGEAKRQPSYVAMLLVFVALLISAPAHA
jgi:hypothetical protein